MNPRALLLPLALLASCCGRPPAESPPPGPAFALRLVTAAEPAVGSRVPAVRVDISADPASRERGLMGRDILPPDTGMLFVYPGPREVHFWMKNCRTPLAAAFLDGEGRILNVVEMAPGAGTPDVDLPYYDSRGPATYVIEMEGGWFHRRGIGAGDLVDLSAALRGVVAR